LEEGSWTDQAANGASGHPALEDRARQANNHGEINSAATGGWPTSIAATTKQAIAAGGQSAAARDRCPDTSTGRGGADTEGLETDRFSSSSSQISACSSAADKNGRSGGKAPPDCTASSLAGGALDSHGTRRAAHKHWAGLWD